MPDVVSNHQWPQGIGALDVHAPVGVSQRDDDTFELWDSIGVGEVDQALELLWNNPKLAELEALCLDQTAASKAFACGERNVIDVLLKMPNTYFGFDPGLKSPLMILLHDDELLDLIAPVLQKGLYLAWPNKETLRGLSLQAQRMLFKGLTVVRKNLETIEQSGYLSAEDFHTVKSIFEYEKARVYNTLLPN